MEGLTGSLNKRGSSNNTSRVSFSIIFLVVLIMGASNASAFETYISSTGSYFNGSVGIGTNSPGEELHVIGDINATGDISTDNYGFFGWLGSLTSRITGMFVQDINVNGNLTLNGTAIDDWGDVSGTADTQKGTSGNYVYNDSTNIMFNETELNATIDSRDSDTTYSHLGNFTDDLGDRGYTSLSNFTNDEGYINSTQAEVYNETDLINSVNTTANIKGLGFNITSELDTKYIAQGDESDLNVNSSSWWNGVSGWVSAWFYKSGNDLTFNETKLNESIDARAPSDGQGLNASETKYLYDDGVVVGLNETELNATIDDRQTSINLTNYALKNQSEIFAGNITTTQIGFFGYLGSLLNRVTTLFVQDIDVNGTITGGAINITTSNGNIVTSGNVTIGDRVGIGTTSPTEKLHLSGEAAGRAEEVFAIKMHNTRDGNPLTRGNAEIALWEGGEVAATELRFYTTDDSGDLNEVIRMDDRQKTTMYGSVVLEGTGSLDAGEFYSSVSTGRVGIGTTSPTYLLDVDGNVSINDTFYVTNDGNVGIGTADPEYDLHVVHENANAAIVLNRTDGAAGYINAIPGRVNLGTVTDDDIAFTPNITVEMTIKSGGNVGIGESNPTEKLHLTGEAGGDDVEVLAIKFHNTDDGNSVDEGNAEIVFWESGDDPMEKIRL